MSTPISTHAVLAAARGDEKTWEALKRAFRINYHCGHYSQFGCDCSECQATTPEQMEALNARIAAFYEELKAEGPPEHMSDDPGPMGEPGIAGGAG